MTDKLKVPKEAEVQEEEKLFTSLRAKDWEE